ncbi:DUF2946 family protein [Chitinibacter sp. SCUT-21]|uniref:DUF2946 family protein n=1 Tax=Chitinibacter sp. SCUT-21 TaxID=2970891 RepID=UPI0035A68A9B
MYFDRLKTRGIYCIALIALCMQMLLPFVHAMQMRDAASGLSGLTLCSVNSPSQDTDRKLPAVNGQMQCPICIASAAHHPAPLSAPSVLPSVREHISSLRLVRYEGFFIPKIPYTLPLSHAPPVDIA